VKKSIVGESVFFVIEWSEYFLYDRISAGRILPDMPGILQFAEPKADKMHDLLLFASWREGLRSGMKNLMDPVFTKHQNIRDDLAERKLFYRYAVIDTSPQDMQDIFYYLLKSYEPDFNNVDTYEDSKRFREISVKEVDIGMAGKVPGFRK
jgi:hypothetical protein